MLNKNQLKIAGLCLALFSILVSGCTGVGRTVADVGLAGLGGVAGYEISGGKTGGAAAGAAAGFVASKAFQTEVKAQIEKAEKEGYQRAMNQAVKQQYWIIQNQQKTSDAPRFIPIQVPAQKIDGVLTNPTVHYIKVEP